MKKFEKLVKEIATGVRDAMQNAIINGNGWFSYERDLKDCTINVECERVQCINGTLLSDYDVWINRDNEEHKNPIVINAIKQALPEWIDEERKYEQEQYEFVLEARYMAMY